jgi:putative ABC transport system permease protein
MRTLIQDLRFGARMLLKNPGFTLVAVLTLALGIGANTTIFSVINAVLLRPLPYQNPEQLVMVWGKLPAHVSGNVGASAAEFTDYRDQNLVFSSVAAYTSSSFNLTGAGEPERIVGTFVSAGLFPLLNIRPALGTVAPALRGRFRRHRPERHARRTEPHRHRRGACGVSISRRRN